MGKIELPTLIVFINVYIVCIALTAVTKTLYEWIST